MSEKKRKVRLEAAAKLAQKGQLEKSIEAYKALRDEEPSDMRTQHKLAEVLARDGQQEEALEVHMTVAEQHTRQGFFARSVAVYKQAQRLDPNNVTVHTRLADLHLKMELKAEAVASLTAAVRILQKTSRNDEALLLLERLVQVAPDNVSARLRHGDALLKAGRRDQAVTSIRAAAKTLKEHGRLAEFVKVAERLIKLRPGDAHMIRAAAEAHIAQGNPKAALARIQTVFKKEPRNPETLALMADAFLGLKQPKKAARVMRERALVFEQSERLDEAKEIFQKVLELSPGDQEAIRFLRLGPAQTGESPSFRQAPEPLQPVTSEATGMFNRRESTQVNRLVAEADSFSQLGLAMRARDCLIRAVQMRGEDLTMREKLLETYLKLDDKSGAVRQLLSLIDEAAAQGNTDLEAGFRKRLQQLGETVVRDSGSKDAWQGDDLDSLLAAATAELEQGELDVSMTIDPIRQILADVELAARQGDSKKAIQMLSDGLDIFPNHAELSVRLERLKAKQAARSEGPRVPDLPGGIPGHYSIIREMINEGDAQQAIDALRDWVEKSVPGQATAHYLAGIALQDLDKTPRGISFLKRALHGEDLPEGLRIFVHYELACAYQSLEDTDEASYYLKRVVRSDPGFLDAKGRLDHISNTPQLA
ncbi:MAG: tetratricopeptide repeat protein [Myxococcota bacterium]|nr:tetratricopeptide repeat protein [Myxococcota bacterium]